MRGHTGGGLTMGRGFPISTSTKQKLNTRSSTESELVGVDDMMPIIRSYKGAVAPASYSTMSGVRCTDLLSEYSAKERVISPTFLVLKVPFGLEDLS